MKNYEVTFIVDPVLSGDEIKSAAQTYRDMLQKEDCKIVHVERMGLRQLAYPINRRSSGVYFCVEFESPNGFFIPKLELSFSRDERIMRFLTARLDKYGVKYNDDKRNGLIGKKREKEEVVPIAETPPVAKETPPVAKETPPVAKETAPVAKETAPVAKTTTDSSPDASKSSPDNSKSEEE